MGRMKWDRPPQKYPGWSLDTPKYRKKRRPRHKHLWEYRGRAGIFDPSQLYVCKSCGRRSVRRARAATPPKPKNEPPLAG